MKAISSDPNIFSSLDLHCLGSLYHIINELTYSLFSKMIMKKSSLPFFNNKMHSMTPRELSENDDLSTSLIIDVYLGFQTHKMNIKFKKVKINVDKLKKVINDFIENQNYEKAMNGINEWIPKSFHSKSKLLQKRLHAHVSLFNFIHLK